MGVPADSFLGPDGPVAELLPGFEPRQAQLEMARAVEEAVADPDACLLVEAGTGVGKSLAYLAPVLLAGVKAVVATATKALQDQLAHDDVPLLRRALEQVGLPQPKVTVVKGRANYLCLRRLELRGGRGRLPGASAWLDRIEGWAQTTATGDRAELPDLPDRSELWHRLDADAETCVGGLCPHRDACFISRLRARARQADLIITNHHLLLADEVLRLGQRFGEVPGSAQLLPDHEVLVVDEGHKLRDVATDSFGASVSSRKLERLGRDVRSWREGLAAERGADIEARLEAALEQVQRLLERCAPAGVERQEAVPANDAEGQHRLARATAALEDLAAALVKAEAGDPMAEVLASRARRLAAMVDFVARGEDADHVYFAERQKKAVRLSASPIDVARALAETVFARGRSVTLCSATLCTDQGFGPIRTMLGLDGDARVTELCLPSPYDYPTHTRLYAPGQPITPDSPQHLERLAQEVERLCLAAGGGAFVLFTSVRVLDAIHAALAGRLPFTVLKQGEAPKPELLRRFREDGDAVLFGTSSFWQGVDVRGRALRLVIIDRLPFASPGDPVQAARARRLEALGGRPFVDLALPEAILELKQGVGRLIRSSTDRGVMAILDGRLVTKPYGRRFLKALPPAPLTRDLTSLDAFFRADPGPASG